ncbi:DNA topoisomerase IV subunit B, partial [Turicibacter sanguinis]|nr:DNA topoisomerase IV subunit B [Turicibacter sanguinis]
KEETFYYEDGIKSFVSYLNEGKDTLHDVVYFEGESQEIEVDFAFQYSGSYSENILSFVNNVRTKDGGTHETGAKAVLTRIFNDYARRNGLLKEKEKNLEGADIREGLAAIVSVRIPENLLQFEGQTKAKLGTPEARSAVDNVIAEKLTFFFEENGAVATQLIKKAIKAAQVREAARKAREDARSGKTKKKKETNLSGKLTPAQTKNPQKNELFLVEGDSAGGSAKLGRNRAFQAILPLRGKVINTEKAKMEDIFKNEEINTMIYTIGAGVGANFELSDVNYDKVIIMTDADTDGAHIQVLLLTFFFRYMRELVEAGKVYIALPPLYKVSKGQGKKQVVEYAWTDEELGSVIAKVGKGYMLQRYKGLGEMNADQLWDTTMNPETRTLIQVSIEDAADADHRVTTLMGDKVEPRREWIEQNVDFTMEDDYDIERV